MNLNILEELNWICTRPFPDSYIAELLKSINIDYDPQQKFFFFLKELDENKEYEKIFKIINIICQHPDIKKLYNDGHYGWNFNFEYLSDHIDNLFDILRSEGLEIEGHRIKNVKSYSKIAPISEEFIGFKFIRDNFYSKLIQDFNEIYRNGIFWLLPFILRKIIENYLIDILRKKFGMKNIDLFFVPDQGRFENFSQLLDNFEASLGDFKPYSAEINKDFINKLKYFREKGNSSAHNLEILVEKKEFDNKKEQINHIINLLDSLLNKIS
ncbi:MAG: hypothetical protein ACFFE4_09890 [Candidatus Thorarchaeota archaeon]